MRLYQLTLSRLAPLALLLLLQAGCSGTNLGQIDESVDSREEMPGPGIFADEQGESSLTWSSSSGETSSTSASTSTAAASTTATATSSTASAADTSVTTEQAEFEQFKAWKDLRENGSDSAEYREFQQWLEYQKFKSSQ